ncbi:IS66 family insertion sequence element accessory protein TnpA [Dyadobacter jejuensis]|uniref:IS66 family insertion sequence element accessory protein TnpA n=1 Tax=Dyadobacter jejuensis TaxID=1082580 RepID=UPI000D6B1D47
MENIQIKNEHYYRQLYGQWKDSNLGVKAFWEQQSVKYAIFRYWIRKCHQACSLRPEKAKRRTVPIRWYT